jgi:hypothetical protein
MDWLRLHPIVVAAVCALVLVLVGLVIAGGSFARTPSNSVNSWDSTGTERLYTGSIIQGEQYQGRLTADDIYTPLAELRQQAAGSVLIPSQAQSGIIIQEGPVSEPLIYDDAALNKLFSTVQASAQISVPSTTDFGLEDIFAYLPFKRTFPEVQTNTTATQSALYTYGNEAGSSVQTYSDRHADQAIVLRRFVEDLGNSAKAEEVRFMAQDLATVGDELSRMDDVPAVARSSHNRVAAGYQQLGALLEAVSTARTDAELLEKITTYNAAADSFNYSLVALATIFSVSEVSFNENDPGRVFVFTPQ